MKKNINNKLRIIGLILMVLITMTKIIPTTKIAGYSVLIGIAFFFIVEKKEKTPEKKSGLRFNTFFKDMKKKGVLPLVLLPILSAILTLIIGDLLFKGEFSTHVLARTGSLLSFDNIPLLMFQVIIAAFGEEIAWRGFFVGKSMTYLPFWISALLSSILFAAGHIAVGNFLLVLYDITTIFIDALIYAYIYKKTDNCFISTVSHILCNTAGIILTFVI